MCTPTYTPEVNPETGQREIVPYIDPVTGRGMVTNLGEGVDMDGYTKASEYVQQQLGRLAGSKNSSKSQRKCIRTRFQNNRWIGI